VHADVRNNPAIYPDDETRQRLFPQKTQDAKEMRAMTRVWSTVKSGI
jgi:putrescine transport system substrate-binding protein